MIIYPFFCIFEGINDNHIPGQAIEGVNEGSQSEKMYNDTTEGEKTTSTMNEQKEQSHHEQNESADELYATTTTGGSVVE